MAETKDMIVPLLREMREENAQMHTSTQKRLDKHEVRLDRIEERQKNFGHALAGDSLMSKMLVGDWEERIDALEKKMKKLEARK